MQNKAMHVIMLLTEGLAQLDAFQVGLQSGLPRRNIT